MKFRFSDHTNSIALSLIVTISTLLVLLSAISYLRPELAPSFMQGRLISFLSVKGDQIYAFDRIFIPSRYRTLISQIKSEGVNILHEFPDKSASIRVSQSDVKRLKSAYPDLIEVQSYTLDQNSPGLKAFDASCAPSKKIEYNVAQVNGGKIGDGSGVKVAVIDTGVDTDHRDLIGKVLVCENVMGGSRDEGCEDKSSIGHGTHVAGIIAGQKNFIGTGMNGVAPSADLLIYKACEDKFCFEDDIVAGIEKAALDGANIIHLGMSAEISGELLKKSLDRHKNILFIASAGNHGSDTNTIRYPAAFKEVVAVAAHDENKSVLAFSSRGKTDFNNAIISDRELEFSAGGSEIESQHNNGCYSKVSGTSFASATIAGVAAKVWDEGGATAIAVRSFLREKAEEIHITSGGGGEFGYDTASGYGMPVAE